MGKFRIIIPLSLIFCFSVIGNVRTKAISTNLQEARDAPDTTVERPIFRVVHNALRLVSSMEDMVHITKDDKSEEEFQEYVKRKLDDIQKMIKEVTSVPVLSGQSWKKILSINDEIDSYFDQVWNILTSYLNHESINGNVLEDNYIHNLTTRLENISVVTKFVKLENEKWKSVSQNIFENDIEISDPVLSGPLGCNEISPLDETHNLFKKMLTIVSKGYTMLLLSEQYRKMALSNDMVQESQEVVLQSYKNNIRHLIDSAKLSIEKSQNITIRGSFSCDPKQWKEGENYIRLKNYVTRKSDQSYWVDGREPDQLPSEHDCKLGYARYPIELQQIDQKLGDLISIPCASAFRPTQKKASFSEFVNYGNSTPNHMKCNLGVDQVLNTLCDRDENSDPVLSTRRISLEVESCRTDKNEVVTSARFHEGKGIIRMEVQCGVIVDGQVDPKSLRWETYNRKWGRKLPTAVLTWELKSFNLDDIALPDDEFLTGVKFDRVDDHFITLVVQGSKVHNYAKGTEIGKSTWHYPKSSVKSRENIDISFLTRPVKLAKQTEEFSKAGKNYINLTVSEWSDEYNNEAIVPFFDTTAYSPSPVTPLGGLGLFYKSSPGYAGFFALKHISPKYMQLIDVKLELNLKA